MDLASIGRTLVLTCAVSFLAACGAKDNGTPTEVEVHRTYLLTLTSSGNGDGAALLKMSTAGVQTLEAIEGQVYFRRVGDNIRIMLLRAYPGALSFRIRLTAAGPTPEVQLLQVADTDNRLRDISSYHVVITGE